MRFAFGLGPNQILIPRKKARKIGCEAVRRIFRMYFHGRMSLREIADAAGVSHMTISRIINEAEIMEGECYDE